VYIVEASQQAQKFLDKLDKNLSERIIERLKKLSEEPIPSDSKFITRDDAGSKIFRYRIGDYRALYKIKEKEKIVLIANIDKRSRVYD